MSHQLYRAECAHRASERRPDWPSGYRFCTTCGWCTGAPTTDDQTFADREEADAHRDDVRTGFARSPRFAVADVLAHCGANRSELARRVGVTRRTVCRWQHVGLGARRANDAAVAVGLHPCNVWPSWPVAS